MASIDKTNFITAFYAPGAVTADAETDMPANYPEIEELLGGLHIASNGTILGTTALVVKAGVGAPGAGFITKVDGNSFRLGTAALNTTRLAICYRAVSGLNDKKLITAILVPGVVAADAVTGVTLPTYYPEIDYVIGGVHMEVTTDNIVRVVLEGAIPAGTLGTGNVSKLDGNTVIMGDACTTSTLVALTYRTV